ncbi:CPBP family intramembrane metalloprotease [Myroides marinus]|uniref:CPBP family intramembrane glutamic endopeptidase n=1 Tax=Myroides marinus TaxID=703342 RepID=UPI0025776ED9|nr:CPBP family intramembrane glutamic endopeptidase [Myroides marinus]MDM1346784.1 CPBP family intramembrane metalloprotease [Myroides marinus]MDM1350461.1 CPBP family intramembrane metalloprotease [Myroides marinus]MDM1357668.1 CPBP family intramembrane metalloprotease [Myroides marinus]MDM1361497.1 CPBP family intramembrane metalloprotease [Myroides marinus]MDM1365103.1 CPBP family intramembrane metalloprotease [Myroides marinus]
MGIIEQLLRINKNQKLWYYLPFSLFFLGIMFLNWISLRYSAVSTNEIIKMNITKYGKNVNFLITIGPLVFMLIFLIGWVLFVHKQSLLSLTTSRSRVDWKRFLFSFGLWSFVIIGFFIYGYLKDPQDYVLSFKLGPFIVFFIFAVILIPLQTSFEEYFMRGYLMQGIGLATRSRAVALISTSIIFGLMHLANPEVEKVGATIMIYYIGTGLFLGIITLMDDGLELALGFHAANNLVGVLLVTSDWTAFQTNSIFTNINSDSGISPWEYIVQVGIVLPLIIFVFAKKYGWKNWKHQLFGRVK